MRFPNRRARLALALFLSLLLASCGGIPLGSLPRLYQLRDHLIDANPAEFMLAIQADARLTPPANAVPLLKLAIRPAEPGAFPPVDKTLPMQMTVSNAGALGLPRASAERRWLVYSLTPSSQAELRRVQEDFKRIRERRQGQKGKGGTLALGIEQDGVAADNPALADTRWESWLQVSKQDGFFELWSGTVDDLLKHAEEAARTRR